MVRGEETDETRRQGWENRRSEGVKKGVKEGGRERDWKKECKGVITAHITVV